MTAVKHVTLWCNGTVLWPANNDSTLAGTTVECPLWTDHGQVSVNATRRLAKQAGWSYATGKDYCPRHTRKRNGA